EDEQNEQGDDHPEDPTEVFKIVPKNLQHTTGSFPDPEKPSTLPAARPPHNPGLSGCRLYAIFHPHSAKETTCGLRRQPALERSGTASRWTPSAGWASWCWSGL